MDRGEGVIVPLPSKTSGECEWKFLLTKDSLKEQIAMGPTIKGQKGIKWKVSLTISVLLFLNSQIIKFLQELDEKVLQFQNDNRPARRYLYFKYLMTYLMNQETGNTSWTQKYPHKGTMWCTPGPYLRKSMLVTLA